MRRAVVVALATAALALTTIGTAAGAQPRLQDRDCGVLLPSGLEATCYWLIVPEDRARPKVATVKLAVMVVHSRSASPEPDPVVFLSGGPGDPGIEGFENFVDSPMLENRDLVLFDQRGTGVSEPSLDCPEVADARVADFRHPDAHDVELDRVRDAMRACRERLVDDGVNLDAYDTVANAADVADLRIALQLDEWNLYGISYGTRLALETMRSHPEGIRTAVLDSVYPPGRRGVDVYVTGVDDAFERLVAACNADESCASLQSNLDELIQQVVDRYNRSPVDLAIADGEQLVVTGEDIVAGLWDAMYDSEIIPALPSVIQALASGDTSILSVFADEALSDDPSEGVFVSMECADNGATRRDVKLAQDPGRAAVVVRYAAEPYCAVWNVDRVAASFRRPVRSRIPTVVFAGSLDPVTPASDSERAANALRSAVYVELAGYGHVVTKVSDCARTMRQEFLDDPDGDLDISCASAPAPAFLSQRQI